MLHPGRVVLPEAVFHLQVPVRQAVLLLAHGDEARMEVFQKILLQRAAPAGEKLPQIGLEAGVVDGGGAVDHRVVMVKDQAAIFHNNSLLAPLPKGGSRRQAGGGFRRSSERLRGASRRSIPPASLRSATPL